MFRNDTIIIWRGTEHETPPKVLLLLVVNLSPVLDDELVDVKLPLAAGVVHEADLAEDRPLRPALSTINIIILSIP